MNSSSSLSVLVGLGAGTFLPMTLVFFIAAKLPAGMCRHVQTGPSGIGDLLYGVCCLFNRLLFSVVTRALHIEQVWLQELQVVSDYMNHFGGSALDFSLGLIPMLFL